jgi:hypothetical protein
VIASVCIAAALTVGARAIALAPRERPAWVLLNLPQDIDPGFDQHYDDLRIVDDEGHEVPYVLDPDMPDASQTAAPLAAATRATYAAKTGDTIVIFDLGRPNTRVTSLHVATTQPEFSRYVWIDVSNDGDFWEDEGVPNLRLTLYGPTHFLVFIAQPHARYALSRTHSVNAPAYDLADLLEHDQPRHFVRASAEERDTLLPVVERRVSRPWVLTTAFGFAIITLLVVLAIAEVHAGHRDAGEIDVR